MDQTLSFERRRRLMGRLLSYGSLALAVAISLTFVALEVSRTLRPGVWFVGIIYGNSLLTAVDCGYGAVHGYGRPGRRLLMSIAAGVAGGVCYAGLFFMGLIRIITAFNVITGNP